VKVYINRAIGLARSQTAKDTYILFFGNILSAVLGFIFTLIIARGLSVSDFGVFSAINNLVAILAAASEIGISAGVVNFISGFRAKGDTQGAEKYLKASLILRLISASVLVLPAILFASFVANRFLATDNPSASYWTSALTYGLVFWAFFPVALQASRRFYAAVVTDLSLGTTRVIVISLLLVTGGITLSRALWAFAIGAVVLVIIGFILVRIRFLKARVSKDVFSKILRFSGWVGVNNLVSGISGRLDVTMLAALAGATATGFYSISSRLAFFIAVLASSFSAVLATRLASFSDKEAERKYILKALLATLPIILGIVVWIFIARPFITILFGQKYLESVVIFKVLAAAMIPFIFATPAVSGIIYAVKKPIYIGIFGIIQLLGLLGLNLILIPAFGSIGPAISVSLVNTILAIYAWAIIYKYYWKGAGEISNINS